MKSEVVSAVAVQAMCAAALIVLLASCGHVDRSAQASNDASICLGSTDASSFAVYLHGIDSRAPGEQELGNRQVLEHIAKTYALRFALPRGPAACGDSICWGWQLSPEQRRAAAAVVVASAKKCFPPGAHYGLVGFSNGGYLVLNYLRACELPELLPDVRWSIAVGSGMMGGPIEPQPADLSACGDVTMMIGTADTYNFDPNHNYLHRLEAKHAHVIEVPFAGGHELPEKALGEQLARFLGERARSPSK